MAPPAALELPSQHARMQSPVVNAATTHNRTWREDPLPLCNLLAAGAVCALSAIGLLALTSVAVARHRGWGARLADLSLARTDRADKRETRETW